MVSGAQQFFPQLHRGAQLQLSSLSLVISSEFGGGRDVKRKDSLALGKNGEL